MISSTLGGLEMALNIATMISKHPSHPKLLGLSKEHPSKSSLSEHWRAFYLLTSLQLSFWYYNVQSMPQYSMNMLNGVQRRSDGIPKRGK